LAGFLLDPVPSRRHRDLKLLTGPQQFNGGHAVSARDLRDRLRPDSIEDTPAIILREDLTRCRARSRRGLLTRLLAPSKARQPPFTERQVLPQLPHAEQFAEPRLASVTGAKLAEERDEGARLQLVQNPSRGIERGDVRTPDGAMPKQDPNGASSTRRLLR
jgi:hypothetical protein